MKGKDLQADAESNRRLINHVFMPYFLPGDCNGIQEDESRLLSLFNDILQTMNVGQESRFKKTRNTFCMWDSVQENLDPGPVSELIKNLDAGDSFALFIREQNCGLMLTVLSNAFSQNKENSEGFPDEEELAVLSTFPSSQPSENITSAEGCLAAVFPYTAVVIPKGDLVNSKSLVKQLHDLDFFDMRESSSIIVKAGHEAVEKRDVADPLYVSKWLTATLADRKSTTATISQLPRVIKKIRDNVIFKETHLPFRRSGLWMTIRVVLQISLVRELGHINGFFFYKLILIKFMLAFLENPGRADYTEGLLVEMMAKISRRSLKLENYLKDNEKHVDNWLKLTYIELMDQAANKLKVTRKYCNTKLEERIEFGKKEAAVDLSQLKLWIHLSLKHSKFNEIIDVNQSHQAKFFKVGKMVVPIPLSPPRHREIDSLFDPNNFSSTTELGIVLYDFERSVVNWKKMICIADGIYVWEVFGRYLETAKSYYRGDPVGTSRMILTLLKMVQFWDSIVIQRFPMLQEHRPGVNLSFTEDLLVPNKEDMEILSHLEEYFQHRESKAPYPSLIEEEFVTPISFSARYGAQDRIMSEVRLHILRHGQKVAGEKLRELHQARAECLKLEMEIRRLECEYIVDHWKRRHNPVCRKCRLSKQERKASVKIYEEPLPYGIECQNAVIFELLIPPQIAILRDMLYLFLSETLVEPTQSVEVHGAWHDYSQINSCNRRDKPWLVSLMSTKKSFLTTHYKELHPSNPDSDFIRPHGYNCCFTAKGENIATQILGYTKLRICRDGVKNRVTLKVNKKSRYNSMQFAIHGNRLTSNDVIAKQNECHMDLSLMEFVEFGSLRSEWKLQWRNIFRALTQNSLSLKEESVLHLINQSIWQAGPAAGLDSEEKLLRQAHKDFECSFFTEEFLKLLDNIRRRHEANWKHHYVLLSIIFIAQRISDFNPKAQSPASKLLALCRKDSVSWSTEIQRILSTLSNAPRSEVDALRIKLIEVNVCTALTFKLSEKMLRNVKFELFLLAVAKIHDNLILLGPEHKISSVLQNLLRRVDEIGVYLEPYIQQAIDQSDLLTCFVETHHPASSLWKMRQQQMRWEPHSPDSHIYYCDIYPQETFSGCFTCEPSRIEMDIIKGRFLVDGCPVGYLPSSIENHEDFQRVFSTKSFEVQPYAFQNGRMITRDKYLGSTYSFYLDMNNILTIIEHRENDIQLELISHRRFERNVPSLLITNYTHWYNFKTLQFEFFYRDDKSVSKLYLEKPEYILEMVDRFLYSVSNPKKVIVDPSCKAYDNVLQVLERLEHYKFINIWCDKTNKAFDYTADMPRMGLQFTVRNAIQYNDDKRYNKRTPPFRLGNLVSKEFRGMSVARDQESLETLIGLKSGLYLQDADVNSNAKVNSILLVPHGKVIFKDGGRVLINVEEIRSPPFFAFEVDSRSRQLKAGESKAGWIYLAYLHALTSQPLPDPFTGVTGTERALQILQSGQCYSNEPLDLETSKTLAAISALSPIRNYYPPTMKFMETVRWLYPTHIMNDAFELIVEELISASRKLEFLFPESIIYDRSDEEIKIRDRELAVRSYWRKSATSSELGRINSSLFEDYIESPFIEPVHPSTFNLNFYEENVTSVMMIAQNGHEWSYKTPTPPVTGLLKSLLLTGDDLNGINVEVGFPIKEGAYCWSKIVFRDYWLDLYNLARKVKRKQIKSEWMLLMSFFAFRGREYAIALDHLRLLQTIAVNSDIFRKFDPPQYDGYAMTKDFVFNREKIMKVLESCRKSWESYLDRNIKEMQSHENELDFAERMRPVHEQLVKIQATRITDILAQKWPIDNCEFIFEIVEYEDRSEIDLDEAIIELNILLKNWFKNRILEMFLTDIEDAVAKLATNVNSHAVFQDMRKSIIRNYLRSELNLFCEKPLFVINLKDVILSQEINIDEGRLVEARRLFNIQRKRKESINKDEIGEIGVDNEAVFPLEMEKDCPILCEYMKDLEQSWEIHHRQEQKASQCTTNDQYLANKDNPKDKIHSNMAHELRKQKTKANEYWELIKGLIRPRDRDCENSVTRQLISSELFPRVLPLTMLPLILEKTPPENKYVDYLRQLIGAYAVLVTLEQKAARCIRYASKNSSKNSQEVELIGELNNKGHENWNPRLRPEWLLFELEMDLMIRPIQAKVAERMENPENDENALVQLNMGEGKTYVIVPLLVLSLADGKNLCRVTVLKSLYQMNKNSLICKIGGIMLNRRVYSFPCRRDYKIGCEEAKQMLEMYKECQEQGGVIMTLPEHRLSFELKAYERCHAQKFNDARSIIEVQDWLKLNARDILDESDEILHVKYQLIYTLGKQLPIGGGSLRWTVIQDLLRIIPKQIELLLPKYGPSCLEYKSREQQFKFPYCRILKNVCAEELCFLTAQEILAGHTKIKIPDVTREKKQILLLFLTKEQLDRETLNAVYKMYPTTHHQEILLILRGFLACGVLCTSLTKRWRVNYGVNPAGYRRMAVPFRAKDVASDRTEFGHPDVAIILTQLSYYYSGLTDEQLEHCFVILFLEPNPAAEYSNWVSYIPKDYPGLNKISCLTGVNLNDFFQKTETLFPAMRDNVACIDFWLGRVVFPQESKQFGWKIGCSPWDLSLDKNNREHPTTGFSGTNDSKILLPKTITQRDLPELQGTNGNVLKNLLLKENDNYEALELGVTGKQILAKLVDANIRVLLDVGALMLELNNEQVARRWLKLLDDNTVDVDAAVYFDEFDKLVVLDSRSDLICAFELSTFRTRLDRCVIYLDDVHTRGTDLKIPMGFEACVTLGKGVTKDKLVQGCMRMRKLGQPDGHRVKFWASQEVHNAIKGLLLKKDNNSSNDDDQKIGAKEVLQWAIKNNQQQIKDGFIHWASSGVYMAQKLSSLLIFNTTSKRDNDLIVLSENCSLKEQIDLTRLYGDVRTLQRFPVIVQHLLKRVNRELEKLINRKTNLKLNINKIVEFFGQNVVVHSQKYVGDLLRSTQLLDEEQERELEHELEAQHQKQNPAKAKSAEHSISEKVRLFIMTGRLNEIENWAVKLPLTLKSTSIWNLYPSDVWAKNVYASRDFSQVITSVSSKDKTDDFLRPVNWIASVQYNEENNDTNNSRSRGGGAVSRNVVLLLLSPYEVNAFMELFRSGTSRARLHMYAPTLTDDQETLHRNCALVLPYQYRHVESTAMMSFSPLLNSCLLLYSGSSYFKDKKEQEEYCRFIGFCPRPRSAEEEAIFEAGGIVDGFVLSEFIDRLPYMNGTFQENPEKLIRGIIQRRFGSFSMDSHVGQIVFQCMKPFQ